MSGHFNNDIKVLIRGVQLVSKEACKLQEKECLEKWGNSSIKTLLSESTKEPLKEYTSRSSAQNVQANFLKISSEVLERSKMVVEGLKAMSLKPSSVTVADPLNNDIFNQKENFSKSTQTINMYPMSEMAKETPIENPNISTINIQSREKIAETMQTPAATREQQSLKHNVAQNSIPVSKDKPSKELKDKVTVKTRAKVKQTLSATSKQRAVPATRLSRLFSFGSLAAGLGVGTVAEASRRALGITKASNEGSSFDTSAFLSEANAERIVNTLCKVRGAALKIGQILSIQDNSIISPQLQKAFERVRQSADFMPAWQVEKVMSTEFGADWQTKIASFETKPFAAASIGQVHLATLHDGTPVAMKIQYPGVAQGIESDIDNLVSVMKVWNIFPEGLFIDNLVEVAKRELSWEVDYEREAECTKKFKKLITPYPEYIVPAVVDDLSTKQIFSSELIEGMPVDQCVSLDQETREHICRLVMNLCLKELFEFRYMQTDPNWSNFFYDPESRRLGLLDFGATREYDKSFMDLYIQVIKCAADGDRDGVLKLSQALGFLTGYETKVMEQAHVDTVMILGEVFRKDEPFDFGRQDTTRRVQTLVPTMIYHRLCPPPEQIYSLHRKLSGVFLLCAKLGVAISCRPLLEQVWANYRFGEEHHQST